MGHRNQFLADVLTGLAKTPKQLPCKYLYDEHGSQLFDAICELDEYYLTRCELSIMQQFAHEMGDQIGPGVMLVEYGSGSSIKTRILLDHLPDPVAYVPVDISGDHLHAIAEQLASDYPQLEVIPVCADFTQPFDLPCTVHKASHVAVYFPGSTIGNFVPSDVRRLLKQLADRCGSGGGLLIGIDLKKDTAIIEAAYNDAQGVTDQFSMNLLTRINGELGGTFDCDAFRHVAFYNEEQGRVEIFLESVRKQQGKVGDQIVQLGAGERILTEYSHKYTIAEFAEMAATAGLTLRRSWTDDRGYFGVLHFALVY